MPSAAALPALGVNLYNIQYEPDPAVVDDLQNLTFLVHLDHVPPRTAGLGAHPVGQGVLLGLALIAVVGATFRAFPRFLEHTVHLQSKMAVLFSERTGWREYVIIALCAGIGEEAIFRGGLMTLLDGYTGPAAAIFLSSLVFALFHLAKPLIGAIILVVGVIMGLVYWWTGSLLTVMIGHALYDVWALRRLHLEFIRLGYAPVTDDAV